ncbi:unnamed protein product [Parnassius apollo]|uniref:(apollo) hypothetical protein n=1 Tax=Parnassius apollo TaxID=110799 RepID=A0A8S3X9Z2_PARAO|nr:unnamed protein product [Parnassius apollo]
MNPLSGKEIKSYLDQINDGARSEDDLEASDQEDEDFYPNRDLLCELQSPVDEENDDIDDDPPVTEDPSATCEREQDPQVAFPPITQAN